VVVVVSPLAPLAASFPFSLFAHAANASTATANIAAITIRNRLKPPPPRPGRRRPLQRSGV